MPLMTHYSRKPPVPNKATYAPSTILNFSKLLSLRPLSRDSLFRPAFALTLDGRPKWKIFSNLPYLIRRTRPSHLNLFLIIAIERETEQHISHSLLFQILSVSRVPKTICRQISLEFFFASMLQSHIMSSYHCHITITSHITVIIIASNVLILVCTLSSYSSKLFITV